VDFTENGPEMATTQKELKLLINQMEQATKEKKAIIMVGDANLCADQWDDESYYQFKMATELKSGLAQCGLQNVELGKNIYF
jgi:hypothetical protein